MFPLMPPLNLPQNRQNQQNQQSQPNPLLPPLFNLLQPPRLPQDQSPQRPLPRPLPLHLWQALIATQTLPAALTCSLPGFFAARSSSTSLNVPGQTAALQQNQQSRSTEIDPAALLAATLKVATEEFVSWCRGVESYRDALRPALPDLPAPIWQEGTTLLRDYRGGQGASAPLVIAVPSLVNRAGILDLLPGRSFLRHLTQQARVWLVDWQEPGEAERTFTIEDYIARLVRVIERAQQTGRPVYLLGYCMGGLLALGAARLMQDRQPLDGLVTLATPWDFNGYAPGARAGIRQWHQWLGPWLDAGQPVPVDILQTLFALLQPFAVYEKFRQVGLSMQADDLFIAVEDWLNDGVPLAAPVARTCFGNWFDRNETGQGIWRVGDIVIDPVQIHCRSLIIAPQKDRLVPLPSAAALAQRLPQAKLLTPDVGHVGMIVGRQAPAAVWQPIMAWLKSSAV